jgi:hypothetical protein
MGRTAERPGETYARRVTGPGAAEDPLGNALRDIKPRNAA